MTQDLADLMFECEGEPKQLNSAIGHLFIVDRGKSHVLLMRMLSQPCVNKNTVIKCDTCKLSLLNTTLYINFDNSKYTIDLLPCVTLNYHN